MIHFRYFIASRFFPFVFLLPFWNSHYKYVSRPELLPQVSKALIIFLQWSLCSSYWIISIYISSSSLILSSATSNLLLNSPSEIFISVILLFYLEFSFCSLLQFLSPYWDSLFVMSLSSYFVSSLDMISFHCLNKFIIIAIKFLLKITSRPTQKKFLIMTFLPKHGFHVSGFFSLTSYSVFLNKTRNYR